MNLEFDQNVVNWNGNVLIIIELDKISKDWNCCMVSLLMKVFINNIMQQLHMEVAEMLYWIMVLIMLLKQLKIMV